MKFGYMLGSREDLFFEADFAKKHFDFMEITIQPELLKKTDTFFNRLEKAVYGFEIVGHIHWKITDFNDIKKNIEILKSLGCKKATIHPFEELTIEENAKILNRADLFFQEKGIELLIENVSKEPYNLSKTIIELTEKIPGANITLDIGHANRAFELDNFIDKLGKKVKHIHLHYNVGDFDHAFYENQDDLSRILSKIESFGYNDTILMETFSIIREGQNLSQEFPEIKKLHLDQLKKIKTIKEYGKSRFSLS